MLKKGTLPKPMDLPTRERKWRRSDVEAFFGFSS
jgi:predicted DNA-binding transcriptional regulator AlpA